MKNRFLLFLSLLIGSAAISQGVISGTVTDAETGLPLENASVFAQNTTHGTLSKSDGSFRLPLGNGGYEIVVSFTGYLSQRFNFNATENKVVDLKMVKEDKSLSEVVIMSSNEVTDGWEKYGTFFTDHFLGKTPNAQSTVLQNPEVLKFFYYKRSDKLKIFATGPLLISDTALGYELRYMLDSFVYHYKSDLASYRGSCLYQQMAGNDSMQAAWTLARQKAYYGSRLHFLRSYYDSTLKQEGFTVDELLTGSSTEFGRLVNPYDTAYYFTDSASAAVELWFPQKTRISYYKAKPEAGYLEQMGLPAMPYQVSYVDLLEPILILQNGYFTEQRSWISQGYWSWKNLADALPLDYEPSGR